MTVPRGQLLSDALISSPIMQGEDGGEDGASPEREKTSWSRVENQQSQPTYDVRSGN